jgi:hypothetical protein
MVRAEMEQGLAHRDSASVCCLPSADFREQKSRSFAEKEKPKPKNIPHRFWRAPAWVEAESTWPLLTLN